MIIYKDLVSGDEVLTDVFKMKVVDDIFYEVEGKLKTEVTNKIDDSLIGGNASIEEQAVEMDDDAVQSGIDVVLANRLQETGFNKKSYQVYIKEYMGKVLAHLEKTKPDRVADFKANAKVAIKKVLENFKEYQFFIGESGNQDGMVVLVEWKEEIPYLYYFRDGLLEEKV